MINDISKEKCCGCYSCGDICPKNAIVFQEDEGFLYPKIIEEKCINCNLCDKVCPQKNNKRILSLDNVNCYAANNKHLRTRFDSTSGGVFSALAESFINSGGYVGGALYTDNWSVKQLITNDISDLTKLRSSKYIQSDSSGYYKRAKKLLDSNEKLLFVGLPCQIAALNCYLNKDYSNLFTVELICRYINSPFAYKKYLEYLERIYNSEVVYIKAKNKELGWRELTHKVVFKNGKTYYGIYKEDKFMKASMNANCLSRPSCYTCSFKGFPRYADISLGDCWLNGKRANLDDDTGTSLVILNTKKGESLFNNIKKTLKIEPIDLKKAIEGNPALVSPLPVSSINRSVFFKRLNYEPFDKVVDDMIPDRFSIKSCLKNVLKVIYLELRYSRFHPVALYQFFKLNFFCHAIDSCVLKNKVIYTTPNCVFEISKNSKIKLYGYLVVGNSPFKNSKLETRIRLEKGATLIIGGFCTGGYGFGYGSDIELFEDSILDIKGGLPTNMNTTIICKKKISIGGMTAIGRNVTIRDNNGGHLINIDGYVDSRPIVIGEHVWLCEGATILSGVKIGDGSIIGAKSVISRSFPAHVSVSGNPAKINSEGIEWKM